MSETLPGPQVVTSSLEVYTQGLSTLPFSSLQQGYGTAQKRQSEQQLVLKVRVAAAETWQVTCLEAGGALRLPRQPCECKGHSNPHNWLLAKSGFLNARPLLEKAARSNLIIGTCTCWYAPHSGFSSLNQSTAVSTFMQP